jgi:hypothetical protein
MLGRRLSALAGSVTVLLMFAACGDTTSGTGTPTASPSTDQGGGGEVNTGEAANIPFTSTRNHYRVDAPGNMTESADGTARASRGVESMEIKIVSGNTAADPAAYAASDLNALRASAPGITVQSGPGPLSLNGSPSSLKTVYTYNSTNPVTGNAEILAAVRYYVPRTQTVMAVITYSIVAAQYDPQGADDVANTFRWL